MAQGRSELSKDEEIFTFLKDVQEICQTFNINTFSFFKDRGSSSSYIDFSIQNIKKKFGYEFLDRLLITTSFGVHRATVIGVHAEKLYINIDNQDYAIPLETYKSEDVKIEVDKSNISDFESTLKFQYVHLGFHLTTFLDFEKRKRKDANSVQSKIPFRYFAAKYERNETFLENTDITLRSKTRVSGIAANTIQIPIIDEEIPKMRP